MGTAHEHYDAETAARLLRGLGEDTVAAATTSLLRRGILSKLIRDPKKTKPGRLLKISDPYVLCVHTLGDSSFLVQESEHHRRTCTS